MRDVMGHAVGALGQLTPSFSARKRPPSYACCNERGSEILSAADTETAPKSDNALGRLTPSSLRFKRKCAFRENRTGPSG